MNKLNLEYEQVIAHTFLDERLGVVIAALACGYRRDEVLEWEEVPVYRMWDTAFNPGKRQQIDNCLTNSDWLPAEKRPFAHVGIPRAYMKCMAELFGDDGVPD